LNLTEDKILTLDFWQDSVTYCGKSMPTGTLACAALNFSDELIEKLIRLCTPLNQYMGAVQPGGGTIEQMQAAQESALQIVALLQNVPPFDALNDKAIRESLSAVFSQEYLDNANAYAKTGNALNAFLPEYKKAATLLRVLPVMAHMGYSFGEFKKELIPFAEKLHDSDRTAEGYAAIFGQVFPKAPELDLNNSAWMSTANISVQYVSAVMPGKDAAQLVKRMHYVSFVGMFRSDLFEGLCVGHAPRKCPICGNWFLTTDARHTKYCGGLAPEDKRGRTCRQIGNIRGRAQRELADDHPLKKIYERRTNTIIQKLRRGTIEKDVADVMKRLAKNKLERAISDHVYAVGAYKTEMEQDTLFAEAQKYLK